MCEEKKAIHQLVISHGLKLRERGDEFSYTSSGDSLAFHFDFRGLFLQSEFQHKIATFFWQKFSVGEYQVGGLESAAVPLVSALVFASDQGQGFYIRKSRKQKATFKYVEGNIDPQKKIILVDDVINSGGSFLKQIDILEAEGCTVSAIFCCVQFYDVEYYKEITRRGVEIHALFTLSDFDLPALVPPEQRYFAKTDSVTIKLNQQGKKTFITKLSSPVVFGEVIYYGGSDGYLSAFDLSTGNFRWRKKIAHAASKNDQVFSMVVVGLVHMYVSTRNKIFVIEKSSGTLRSVHNTSNPKLREPLEFKVGQQSGFLYVDDFWSKGSFRSKLSFYKKDTEEVTSQIPLKGSLVAPMVVSATGTVLCADAAGYIYMIDVERDKTKVLHHFAEVPVQVLVSGDELVVVHTDTLTVLAYGGGVRAQYHFDIAVTAFVMKDQWAYLSSEEGLVYKINITTGSSVWEVSLRGKIQTQVTLYGNRVLVGTDQGYLYVLNDRDGKVLHWTVLPEVVASRPHVVQNQLLVFTQSETLSVFNYFVFPESGSQK